MRNISNLEYQDFSNHQNIKVVLDAICSDQIVKKNSKFNIMFSIKEFVKYIRNHLNNSSIDAELKDCLFGKKFEEQNYFDNFDYAKIVILFDKIISVIHCSDTLLASLYPSAPKEFFDKLSGM